MPPAPPAAKREDALTRSERKDLTRGGLLQAARDWVQSSER